MSDTLSLFGSLLPQMLTVQNVADSLLSCNEITGRYGLVLTEKQALTLAEIRTQSLHENGRLEVGRSAAEKLTLAFCDSPYLNQNNFAATLEELTDFFYSFRNDLPENLPDDTLIGFLKRAFDEVYHGSLDLFLNGRLPERYALLLRQGFSPERAETEALEAEPANEVGDIWGGVGNA